MSPDLFPSWGEFRISSDAALDVVFALSVPAQVDGVRMHEDVHEVVDDLALDVVLNTVHQKTTTHVHHLNEGQISGKNKCMLRLGKPSVLVVPAKPWNTIDNYILVWNLSHIFCTTVMCLQNICTFVYMYTFFLLSYLSYSSGSSGW